MTPFDRARRIRRAFARKALSPNYYRGATRAFLIGALDAFEGAGLSYSGPHGDAYLRGASCARRRMHGGCGCGYHISHAPYCPTRSGVRAGR